MTVLAYSLDGQLRIRELPPFKYVVGPRYVVELRQADDTWMWCVWSNSEAERAWSLFESQCHFHAGPHPWIEAYEATLRLIVGCNAEPTAAFRAMGREYLRLPYGEKLGEFVIYGIRRIEA